MKQVVVLQYVRDRRYDIEESQVPWSQQRVDLAPHTTLTDEGESYLD